jgi:polar amino acid transport system ATP-binding protein
MLVAEGIRKHIGRETVLAAASITLERGELVGLIGASGSGKTVFSRSLVGLELWDAGTLQVDDLTIDRPHSIDDPIWLQVRRRVGLVAQNRALSPYRTAYEQIAEGPLFVGGISRTEADSKIGPWIERLGLTPHIHKYPTELSGGQLARVSLARALAMEPGYLICDEITASLDPVMASEVAVALLEVIKSGVGVLMISHQLEFLKQYATRVDFFHAGCVVASGNANSMLVTPTNEPLRQFLVGTTLGR